MTVSGWFTDNFIEIFGAVTGILYVILEIRQNIWLWPVGIITSGVYIWVFFTGKLYADMSLQGYYLVISILGWYWWMKGAGRRAQGKGQKEESGRVGEGEKLAESKVQRARSSEQETTIKKLPSLLGVGLDEEIGRESSFAEATEDKGRNSEAEGLRDEGTERLKVSRLKLSTGIALSVIFILLFTTMWLVLDSLTDSPVPVWDSFITSLSIIATWMLARKIYEHWFLWIVVNAASVVLFLTRGFYPTVLLYAVYCSMSFVGLKAWRRTIQKKQIRVKRK